MTEIAVLFLLIVAAVLSVLWLGFLLRGGD
jgi:hypothetical protein